jgi:hypothetical protein
MPTDPNAKPVTAEELAHDNPEAADAPVLHEAEDSGETPAQLIESGLTGLPPG